MTGLKSSLKVVTNPARTSLTNYFYYLPGHMNSKQKRNKARAAAYARRQCFCREINRERETVALPCCNKHAHEDCLSQWIRQSKTCPICRASLVPFINSKRLTLCVNSPSPNPSPNPGPNPISFFAEDEQANTV